MISVPSTKMILAVGVSATALALLSRGGKVTGASKIVYRQIGAGWTLDLEAGRSAVAVGTLAFCLYIPRAKALGYLRNVFRLRPATRRSPE